MSFSSARACWSWYKHSLATRPLVTKALTASTIMSASDVLTQAVETTCHRQLVDQHGPTNTNLQEGCPSNVHCPHDHDFTHINPPRLFHQDWNRTSQVAVTGLVYTAPISHIWYYILDRFVTISSPVTSLAVRLLLDAFLFSPVAVAGYFSTRTILEGGSWRDLETKLTSKWRGALEASWHFWPVVNIVNFSVVPVPFRVLYNNCWAIVWNMYMTHVNGKRLEEVVETRINHGGVLTDEHIPEGPCLCSHCREVRA